MKYVCTSRINRWSSDWKPGFNLMAVPPPYVRSAHIWLNANFPQHWIGCGGPELWPAIIPDLTPFLYGRT